MIDATKPVNFRKNVAPNIHRVDFKSLERIENMLISKKELAPQELLKYQVMAQRYQLQIEFATRVADGISNGVKRLQTQNQ
ncbi:MAG: hypothetical protein NZT61_03460 [Deltaproteobacteria bacterium]|nr:hypothetical protein [Deltaproteobacteria bacterium]